MLNYEIEFNYETLAFEISLENGDSLTLNALDEEWETGKFLLSTCGSYYTPVFEEQTTVLKGFLYI